MNVISRLLIILIFGLIPTLLMGQGQPYKGPIDPAGDPSIEREGFMNGNRFRMLFNNNTQLADYPRRDANKWPDNDEGTKLIDVCAVLIGAEVYITQDSIPVTDLAEVARLAANGLIDTLIYVQSQDYSDVGAHALDYNWNRTVEWALSPVPGYVNLSQDFPAMSNKPDSWPNAWPSEGLNTKWPGEWNGRFGRGIKYADLESYFVANDAQDLEYIVDRSSAADQKLITDGPRYYPRPGKFIGDDNFTGVETSTQVGFPWGGLGLRVEVRGYQWNNPESRDIIFWEYNIANISDYDLPTCGFGYWIDPSIGGDSGGDNESGFFNQQVDMTYIWEGSGLGGGGLTPGVMGMAYLESPGNPNDNADNDDDGLVDERRDNPAGDLIGATEGIQDMQKFLDFYKYKLEELKPHYAGDEDQDWQNGIDLNGNGVYAYFDEEADVWKIEEGESSGDDVGLDGVGPLDLNYNGPDEGEGNGKPDYILGVGCEPNFNATDVSESDMIGLTTMHLMDYGTWTPAYQIDKDEAVWGIMSSGNFPARTEAGFIFEFFASAEFPFHQGTVERVSIGMLAAYDELIPLNNENSAPNLFKKKANAQIIYERDYRFSQPPLLPTLQAYPGDGKVILTWNDVADKFTREPLLARVNDFQGYKLYRATDKLFQDPEIITNAQGIKSFRKPIFQCDLADSIEGYAEFGINNVGREGTAYYLGSNTGLSYSYIDEDVQNGRNYYYALVAYDYGIKDLGISPAENNIDVELDEAENIIRLGKNIKVVMPQSQAAGYIPPNIHIDEDRTSPSITSGKIIPEVMISQEIKENHVYRVKFGTTTMQTYRSPSSRVYSLMDGQYAASSLFIYDETDGDKLIYSETAENHPRLNILAKKSLWDSGTDFDYVTFNPFKIYTERFDGIRLQMNLGHQDSTKYDFENSGWVTGNSNMDIITGPITDFFPWDYDIIFTEDVSTVGTKSLTSGLTDANEAVLYRSALITNHLYNFYIVNTNSIDTTTGEFERLDMIVHDINRNGTYEFKEDNILVSHNVAESNRWAGTIFALNFANVEDESGLPNPGDVYRIRFKRPISEQEEFVFKVIPETKVDEVALEQSMESIKVVPNPYIASNTMEGSVLNQFLNQRRRIMFTHLPADCNISIFTPSGLLVDEIQVRNNADNGTAHWDLLTKEDLEIAAGMYIWHIKSNKTGNEKFGKFAVIK